MKKILIIVMVSTLIGAIGLHAQSVGQTISAPPDTDWRDIELYRAGNRLFVADVSNGQILVYDSNSLSSLSPISLAAYLPSGPYDLMVHEGTGTLYAAVGVGYEYGGATTDTTLVVIDADTSAVIGALTGLGQGLRLAMDESRARLYTLGPQFPLTLDFILTAVDIPTNQIAGALNLTDLIGFQNNITFNSDHLNQTTGELYFGGPQGKFVIVAGPTLAGQLITVAGSTGWGGTWNPRENKFYVTKSLWDGYFVFDRDTSTSTVVPSLNDGTGLFYSDAMNRVYSGAEINRVTTVIEGSTDESREVDLRSAYPVVGFVNATHHAYFTFSGKVRILEESTMQPVASFQDRIAGGVVGTVVRVNQGSGRVFILNFFSEPENTSWIRIIDDRPTSIISGNAGVAGAHISFVDGTAKSVVSDTAGHYAFPVSLDWSGVVTPTLSGYSFSPSSRSYSNIVTNKANQDYLAASSDTYSISGTVRMATVPLPGVVLNGLPNSPMTDEAGEYTTTVVKGWSGTVAPILPGYIFLPVSRSFLNVSSDKDGNMYSATAVPTVTVSGVITAGGSPLPGVAMSGFPANVFTNASGQYYGVVNSGWSGTITPTMAGYAFTPASSTWSNLTLDQVRDYTADPASVPEIGISVTSMKFGAVQNGIESPVSAALINNTGTGILHWTAVPSSDWLSVSPGSGTGNGTVTIGIARKDLSPGAYQGTVTVSDPAATNSPRVIMVNYQVYAAGDDVPPFGEFDTPVDQTTVLSSIPVTGWALDNIGLQSVKIYRGTDLSDRAFIGDAVFVEGARPDVEAAYPGYPQNRKAGWGYMMLTNFLPQGDGPYTLLAYAKDLEGNEVLLGQKAITVNNAAAINPFGAIDTPTQGGTASGNPFYNFGWALTPQPKSIPVSGATINVWVDGAPLGHPSYNHYRADIAGLFPGYANANGAIGVFNLNTTEFANGLHTIQWSVLDSAGNADGIGSRYFSVQNTGNPASGNVSAGSGEDIWTLAGDKWSPLFIRRSLSASMPAKKTAPDSDGSVRIIIPEVTRLAVYLDEQDAAETEDRVVQRGRRMQEIVKSSLARYEAFSVVLGEIRPLPVGATFDPVDGVLFWQPGPGFLGEYEIVIGDKFRKVKRILRIRIHPS